MSVAVSSEDSEEWYLGDPETEVWISVFRDGRIKRGWVCPFSAKSLPQAEWPSGRLLRGAGKVVRIDGGFKAELVYSGVSGNTTQVAYREDSEDMAPPGFSQEVQ